MAVRRPDLAKYVEDGMGPGLTNPLGARAMYLFNEDGKDTLFRLHGTPEWASIGTAASSGCIRLMNQDVIDLYSRVRPGKGTSKVVVIQ
jgi:lipoprotein-anchoring transpeptidase ErfK/SrfK